MFRAILIVLLFASPSFADAPPRYHKGGATVAKFHATKLPKPKPAPQASIRHVTPKK